MANGTTSYQTPSRYTQRLEKEYSPQTGVVGGAKDQIKPYEPLQYQGKSQYDVQRERLGSQLAAEEERRREALQRQLAAQGMQRSGVGLRQQQQQTAMLEQARAAGMSDIALQQLQAAEKAREQQQARAFAAQQAQQERQFQRGERLGTQAYTAEQMGLGRGFESEQAAAAREFQERQAQLQRQFQAEQAQLTRGLQRELTYADLGLEEKRLAQQADQFGDKLDFDRYALQGGWSQQEADRAWQAAENERTRQFQATESLADRQLQERLAERGFSLEEQQLALQSRQQQINAQQFQQDLGLRRDVLGLDTRVAEAEIAQRQAELAETARQFNESTGLERERLGQELVMQQNALDASMDELDAQIAAEEQQLILQGDQRWDELQATLLAEAERQQAELQQEAELTGRELTLRESQLASQAQIAAQELQQRQEEFRRSFGLERERLAADVQMAAAELESIENRLQTEIDARKNLSAQEYMQEYNIQNLAASNEAYLAEVRGAIEADMLTLEDNLAQAGDLRKARSDSYFNRGAAGQTLPAEELTYLRENDPLSYYAYQAGQAGMTAQDTKFQQDMLNNYIDAMVLNISESLGEADFEQNLNSIFSSLGFNPYNVPGLTGTRQGGGAVTDEENVTGEVSPQDIAVAGAMNTLSQRLQSDTELPASNRVAEYGIPPDQYRAAVQQAIQNPGQVPYLTWGAQVEEGVGTTISPEELTNMKGQVVMFESDKVSGLKPYIITGRESSPVGPVIRLISPDDGGQMLAAIGPDSEIRRL